MRCNSSMSRVGWCKPLPDEPVRTEPDLCWSLLLHVYPSLYYAVHHSRGAPAFCEIWQFGGGVGQGQRGVAGCTWQLDRAENYPYGSTKASACIVQATVPSSLVIIDRCTEKRKR